MQARIQPGPYTDIDQTLVQTFQPKFQHLLQKKTINSDTRAHRKTSSQPLKGMNAASQTPPYALCLPRLPTGQCNITFMLLLQLIISS